MKQTPPEVEHRRFESLHAEAGAHLQTYTDTEDTKGRITTRTLTASTLLTEHTHWPGLQQVYQYITHQKQKSTAHVKCHAQYGIMNNQTPVSYTHLTLPTILLV